ncbi:hypothetical protein [Burkholderia alba]|uniref:hypothetical protein n=1 Tax=Burkholderia alba TaxID=2683677 RepID=UPI002B057699|nr:hypothetical protein [Burkholderia alba]
MFEIDTNEIEAVSGSAAVIPVFPTGFGLVDGAVTILTAAGYIISVAGTNLALGLSEALGVPTPNPQ